MDRIGGSGVMSFSNNGGIEGHPQNFATVALETLPRGRKSKHHILVAKIVNDLEVLPSGTALKIPRSVFNGHKLVNIRSALNRATRNLRVNVSTSTDDENFYVWKT
jgi:hypothetical protein